MTATPQNRLLAELREQVIDILTMNYAHDKLSQFELDRRLETAMYSESSDELMALTSDLELEPDEKFYENKRRELGEEQPQTSPKEDAEYQSYFCSKKRVFSGQIPKHMKTIDVFSSGTLDLSEADFTFNEYSIHILCVFSSLTIIVPEHMNVSLQTQGFFSNEKNRVSGTQIGTINLMIRGNTIFSDIKVKTRGSLKKHFMNFADGLRRIVN